MLQLGGLHHVTAVTANASRNVAFYTQVLGMRLVKKTVNQDDVSAYHLFYGDEIGHAGTEMTFFDWSFAGRHTPAAGMISATAFRVPGRAALDWWLARFQAYGVDHDAITERHGRAVLAFRDPEGQRLELVDDTPANDAGVAPGVPWAKSPVAREYGIRGLEGVTLTLARVEPTALLLRDILGFREVGAYSAEGATAVTYEVGPGGPGAEVRLVERTDLPRRARIGAGGVHHVAFRTPDAEQHVEWREKLARAGLGVTEVIDRYYFRSIYFREPGGVLFEIATEGPGFTGDEDAEHLGERLSLPPFLVPHRAQIEAGLTPIEPIELTPSGAAR